MSTIQGRNFVGGAKFSHIPSPYTSTPNSGAHGPSRFNWVVTRLPSSMPAICAAMRMPEAHVRDLPEPGDKPAGARHHMAGRQLDDREGDRGAGEEGGERRRERAQA